MLKKIIDETKDSSLRFADARVIEKDEKKKKALKSEKYLEAIGRRKTAVARVRVFTGESKAKQEKSFFVNQKPLEVYFPGFQLQQIVKAALEKMNYLNRFKISVIVKGGGYHSQAEAVRHGLARALVLFNADFRKQLKKAGFLRRDARMRERKKFGLKRARRAPQWAKR